MNRRTKILVVAFGTLVAGAFVSRVIYPAWIEPLVTIEDRIAAARETLDKLEDLQARAEQAKRQYRRFAERAGAMDLTSVANSVHARLNDLILKHRLEEASVVPSRGTSDRKTGLERMLISVAVTGSLESAMGFLRDVVELPQLLRVGNVTISPTRSGKTSKKQERVTLRVPIDVLVLPQQKMLGERLVAADFQQPDKVVRHQGRDYSLIWKQTPFSEFEPLPPLVANAGREVNVEQGRPAYLQASATGGDGRYTFTWSPAEGISSTTGAKVTVDTAEVRTQVYSLTVTDESENSATATVNVTIREPAPVVVRNDPPPPPPPPPGPKRWPDNKFMHLAMALMRSDSVSQRHEFIVQNTRTNERTYHALGEEFDGGELVFVHPRGGLVRRHGEYYVYPLGGKLDQDMPVDTAANFPDLQRVASELRLAEQDKAAEVAEDVGEAGLPRDAVGTDGREAEEDPVPGLPQGDAPGPGAADVRPGGSSVRQESEVKGSRPTGSARTQAPQVGDGAPPPAKEAPDAGTPNRPSTEPKAENGGEDVKKTTRPGARTPTRRRPRPR